MATKAEKAAEKIAAAIRKSFGADSALMLGQGGMAQVKEVIPTGISVLDHYVLGCGGLPVGRISEVYGPEAVGKTSFQLLCIAAVQRMGGLALLVDSEYAMSASRAKVFGVDVDRLILMQPNNMEEAAGMLVQSLRNVPAGVGPILACWDSLAASPPEAELKGEGFDAAMGARARLLNNLFRQLPRLAAEKQAHVMVINQIRSKIGVVFGNPEVTPGGPSLKFAASIRIRLGPAAKGQVRDGADVIGQAVVFKNTKNKVAEPLRQADVRLIFKEGWDERWSVLNFAKDRGIVPANTKLTDESYAQALEAIKTVDVLTRLGAAEEETDASDE